MAYDETLAGRIRQLLIERDGYVEKKMFGGICYLLQGNMACGIVKDCLIARVGPQAYAACLDLPHAAIFDLTGRPMTGWIQVCAAGTTQDQDLAAWVQRGIDFALSLPAKNKAPEERHVSE